MKYLPGNLKILVLWLLNNEIEGNDDNLKGLRMLI